MQDKYEINYEDERFKNLENEKNQQITDTTNRYDQMINNSDKFYQDQINASKEYSDKQTQIQQQQTDFAIEKINQQKEQSTKDYTREQKASYVDYMKQINPYSVDAEKLAANGLQNSGYGESSRVSMWNTYQNRYATARESYNNAILNYDNGIKEAQLANSSALAQIAYNSLQQELELSIQGFQYKNSLIQQKEASLNQVNQRFDNKYQNVLAEVTAELERQMQIDKIEQEYELELKKILQQYEESSLRHNEWMKEFDATQKQRAEENELSWKKLKLEEEKNNRDYQLALASANRAISNASNYTVSTSINNSVKKPSSAKDVIANMKTKSGPGISKPVVDGYSGKSFKNIDELLNYYGYAMVN